MAQQNTKRYKRMKEAIIFSKYCKNYGKEIKFSYKDGFNGF